MALPPAVWHRVANATDLWDCSACGFTATSMQQATHNSWHNQLATTIQKVEGDAMVAKNELLTTKKELATAQTEIQMLRQLHYTVVAELDALKAKIQPGIKTPETPAPKKIMKRKRELCFECGLPSHPKDKLHKYTIAGREIPTREVFVHSACWDSWTEAGRRKAARDAKETRIEGEDSVGLFQQRDHTNVRIGNHTYSAKSAIGIERPEFKESDYNGITQEQEADAIARLFGESK